MSSFEAELEEEPNGYWRASGVFHFLGKHEKILEPSTFPDEDSARAWLNKIGKAMGFQACLIRVIPQNGRDFVTMSICHVIGFD